MDAPGSIPQGSYLEAMPKVAASPTTEQSSLLDQETSSKDDGTDSVSPVEAFTPGSSSGTVAIPRRRDLRQQFLRIFLTSLGILQAVKAVGILIRARKLVSVPSTVGTVLNVYHISYIKVIQISPANPGCSPTIFIQNRSSRRQIFPLLLRFPSAIPVSHHPLSAGCGKDPS